MQIDGRGAIQGHASIDAQGQVHHTENKQGLAVRDVLEGFKSDSRWKALKLETARIEVNYDTNNDTKVPFTIHAKNRDGRDVAIRGELYPDPVNPAKFIFSQSPVDFSTAQSMVEGMAEGLPAVDDANATLVDARATTDTARTEADKYRYHDWSNMAKLFGNSVRQDKEGVEMALKALDDIRGELDEKFGEQPKMTVMSRKMKLFMSSREILDAVFTAGNSGYGVNEVHASLQDKLGLSEEEASELTGVLRDVSRVGFDADYAKWNAETAEIGAFIKAQAAEFAEAANAMMSDPTVSRGEAQRVLDLEWNLSGPSSLSLDEDVRDVFYDSHGEHIPELKEFVEGARAIAREIRIAFIAAGAH